MSVPRMGHWNSSGISSGPSSSSWIALVGVVLLVVGVMLVVAVMVAAVVFVEEDFVSLLVFSEFDCAVSSVELCLSHMASRSSCLMLYLSETFVRNEWILSSMTVLRALLRTDPVGAEDVIFCHVFRDEYLVLVLGNSSPFQVLSLPRFVDGSFPRPLSPITSTLNAPSATKIYIIIARSMEQLVVKF
jgi:hypothetical protein